MEDGGCAYVQRRPYSVEVGAHGVIVPHRYDVTSKTCPVAKEEKNYTNGGMGQCDILWVGGTVRSLPYLWDRERR